MLKGDVRRRYSPNRSTDVNNQTPLQRKGLTSLVRYKSLRHLKSISKKQEEVAVTRQVYNPPWSKNHDQLEGERDHDITYSSRTATL